MKQGYPKFRYYLRQFKTNQSRPKTQPLKNSDFLGTFSGTKLNKSEQIRTNCNKAEIAYTEGITNKKGG